MMKKYICIILWILIVIINITNAQITLTTSTQINTVCNGNPCTYNGPKILINEVMLSPATGDGSMYDQDNTRRGEWIELYNPDICQSIDVSCFFLGNSTPDGSIINPAHFSGGFVIPNGTIVPPRGFVLIRGDKAAAVPSNLLIQNGGKTIEIVVGSNLISNICLGGGDRLWFPNAGGWFAFYDSNGQPQDAISWYGQTNSCMSCSPCNPLAPGCGFTATLSSYDSIPASKKNYITPLNPANSFGFSFRRIPDGGNWMPDPSSPTYGRCNTICIPPPIITCNGKAVVFPSGGQPPYTYLWDDQQHTTNDTVIGLCEGIYNVIVTDAINQTATTSIQIHNLKLIPEISVGEISCKGGNDGTASATASNGKSPFSYLWNNNDTTSVIHNLTAANYSVIITDTNDCKADTSFVLPESSVILMVSVNSPTICSRNATVLTANPSIQGGTYTWFPYGQQLASITVKPLLTSSYSIEYTYAGCIAKDTSVVTVNQSPLVKIHTSSYTITAEDSVVISASGGLSYLWNNACTSDTMILYPMEDTIYCVTASNNNGCFDAACVKIEVIGTSTLYVPNSFTPNGNGINDVFYVPYTNIKEFHIHIFNRWGNLLFEANDIHSVWDGKYKGELVEEGVYIYSIEAIGEDNYSYRKLGSLTVLW